MDENEETENKTLSNESEKEIGSSSIFQESIDSMPDVSETVDDSLSNNETDNKASNIGIINKETENENAEASSLRDSQGLSFDPEIHVSPPQTNSKGFLKRKRGAKKKSVSEKLEKETIRKSVEKRATSSNIGGISTPEKPLINESEPQLTQEDYERHAAGTVLSIETCGLMFLGSDAKMDTQLKQNMIYSYAECYKEYGIIKTPPWMAAAAVTAGWIVPVLQKEEPKSRIEKYKIKIGTWYYKLKNRKKKGDFAPEKENKKEEKK